VEVAAVQAQEAATDPTADLTASLWDHALAIRDLLKYEFFFATKAEFDAEIRAETALALPDWNNDQVTADSVTSVLRASPLLLAHRVVGPFLEATQVVADRLATREPAAPVDQDALVAESLGVARQRWLQRELHSAESISKDLMTNAVKLAGNRDLLGPGGDELRAAREAFAAELDAVVAAVGVVRDVALRSISVDRSS
jgi:glycerol-3-phosphate O-acyltransferase